ncbi:MAG TPA: TIGR00645 family protein [Hyphomicrobiales bacterium]|nr:TIGR00645 family protein [Hyphomicrobiales bacterium]
MIERALERLLFASRWVLAPFFLGLAIGLVVLLVKFVQELVHLVESVLVVRDTDLIAGVLALIDLALLGSLVLVVIFAGYENFVSKFHPSIGMEDRPSWMGTIDFGGLKLKLLASIVAISAIQLLKSFMNVDSFSDRDLFWMTAIHVVFVISSVLLALSDRLSEHSHEAAAGGGEQAGHPSSGAAGL